tara:strand:- start:253 stop:1209 length:957 start_codon:yes stop_codon:yes gene_type:complete
MIQEVLVVSEVSFPEPKENNDVFSDDDLEIIEINDTPDVDRKPVRDDVEPFNIDEEIDIQDDRVKKRLNRLKYEYHQQRREKESAQRLRDEAVNFAQTSQGEVSRLQGLVGQSEQALLQSVQSRTEAELGSARDKYKKAHEEGDTDSMVEAQEQLARIQADRAYIANYQPQMQPSTAQDQSGQAMPVEQPPQQQPVDPQLQGWLSQNTWFGAPGNEALTGFTYGLDEMLVKRNIERYTPQYFQAINEALRETFPQAFAKGEQQASQSAKRSSTVVASAQRGSKGKRQVALSSSEIELTKKLGITPQQYAMQKMRMGNE